jgi:hypothetical protein
MVGGGGFFVKRMVIPLKMPFCQSPMLQPNPKPHEPMSNEFAMKIRFVGQAGTFHDDKCRE